MMEIDLEEIDQAYCSFCKELNFSEESILSIAEFVVFAGYELISPAIIAEGNGVGSVTLNDDVVHKIRMVNDQYSQAILKMYQARRNTFRGHVRANTLKPVYAFLFWAGLLKLILKRLKITW